MKDCKNCSDLREKWAGSVALEETKNQMYNQLSLKYKELWDVLDTMKKQIEILEKKLE